MENNHGGANRGQGRKSNFGEKTKLLCIRVPISLPEKKAKEIKEAANKILEEYKTAK